MADWSQLPQDLLAKISFHLETSTDLLRFRSVCTTWRSSAAASKRHRFSNDFPIIPDDGVLNTVSGFRLSRRSLFLVSIPNPCNQTNPYWLIKIEQEDDNKKRLFFNPFARSFVPHDSIRVLDFMNFRVVELGQEFVLHYLNHNAMNDLYMEKVVLLCNDRDFLLLTIHVSGKLAVFGSREKNWSVIEDMPSPYDDAIAYKEDFYAVDNNGRIVKVLFELNSKSLELVADSVYGGDKKYLVESDGDLLLIDTYLNIDTKEERSGGADFLEEDDENFVYCAPERAVRFKVYQMDWMQMKWVELKSLDDRLLFIGDNCTFSMSATELKMPNGMCRGNCVIFWHTLSGEEEGLVNNNTTGVFYLETGCIVPLHSSEYSRLFWPPPQWLTSTLVQQENHCKGQSSSQ